MKIDSSQAKGLNPLKRVNSILTELKLILHLGCIIQSLNPLKRVNSILTEMSTLPELTELRKVSIPSNGSIQFLLHTPLLFTKLNFNVSIPSNGSIQFLREFNIFGSHQIYSLNPLKRVNSILT